MDHCFRGCRYAVLESRPALLSVSKTTPPHPFSTLVFDFGKQKQQKNKAEKNTHRVQDEADPTLKLRLRVDSSSTPRKKNGNSAAKRGGDGQRSRVIFSKSVVLCVRVRRTSHLVLSCFCDCCSFGLVLIYLCSVLLQNQFAKTQRKNKETSKSLRAKHKSARRTAAPPVARSRWQRHAIMFAVSLSSRHVNVTRNRSVSPRLLAIQLAPHHSLSSPCSLSLSLSLSRVHGSRFDRITLEGPRTTLDLTVTRAHPCKEHNATATAVLSLARSLLSFSLRVLLDHRARSYPCRRATQGAYRSRFDSILREGVRPCVSMRTAIDWILCFCVRFSRFTCVSLHG